MTENHVQEIMTFIRRRYKSLENPNFSFVAESISKYPYEDLIRQIRTYFQVQEETDPNEDVSFSYSLFREQDQWILRISMIGPYAVLLRVGKSDASEIVSCTVRMLSISEKELMNILADNGIRLLDHDTLCLPIPLKLFNAEPENTRVYQALFTDSDFLPWEE